MEEIAEKYGIPTTASIPIDAEIAEKCDEGRIEECKGDWLDPIADTLAEKLG